MSALLGCLRLSEKAQLLYGVAPPADSGAVGYVPGVRRLGVPPLILSDGPAGLRDRSGAAHKRAATALPAPVALAASFDPALAEQYGRVLGSEARGRGVSVLYAPAINLVRVPVGGRNFEYLGEDPYLAGRIAAPEVRGIQAEREAAQVKHFALNNQENERATTSSNASERVIQELYLPAWRAAVQSGHAWSVMCADNMVNGTYACQNRLLLRDVLRNQWRFDGVVASDYGATHSAGLALRAGLDQSFTLRDWGAYYRDLPRLVRSGAVRTSELDAAVRRVLLLMIRVGLLDGRAGTPAASPAAHEAFARAAAEEGAVLLRNEHATLPLNPPAGRPVAVIGPYAKVPLTGGRGSSHVRPFRAVSVFDALRDRLGPKVPVSFADGSDLAAAAATARAASAAVVVVGDVEQENADRPDLSLPKGQDQLVAAVAAANPRTIVALHTGGPVAMPWLGSVSAVLEAWYPGGEGGAAIARLVMGDVDPSGHLPVTFPTSMAQGPVAGPPRYPAERGAYAYTEGLLVGYRWYDAHHLVPLFPFGYGLSYTTFRLSRLRVAWGGPARSPVLHVTVAVANTGRRAGTDLVQLYVSDPAAAGEPPHQLKGFARVALAPGASRVVGFALDRAAFASWDEHQHRWVNLRGAAGVAVGNSVQDLPLRHALTLR